MIKLAIEVGTVLLFCSFFLGTWSTPKEWIIAIIVFWILLSLTTVGKRVRKLFKR